MANNDRWEGENDSLTTLYANLSAEAVVVGLVNADVVVEHAARVDIPGGARFNGRNVPFHEVRQIRGEFLEMR